jgi:hypothetical protein
MGADRSLMDAAHLKDLKDESVFPRIIVISARPLYALCQIIVLHSDISGSNAGKMRLP